MRKTHHYTAPVDTYKVSSRTARYVVENLADNTHFLPSWCERHEVFFSNDHTMIYVDSYYARWFLILILPFLPLVVLYSILISGIGETVEGLQNLFLQKKYGNYSRNRFTTLHGINVKNIIEDSENV